MKEEQKMKIGFIGLGIMGSKMATRLASAGYELIVFNRTREKTIPFVRLGAKEASSIATLAQESEIICTCLSMPSDSIEVYLGEDGILSNAKSGTICLDFTTVGRETSQIINEQGVKTGIVYLDTPVSGGPEGAMDGTLTIMVGGAKEAYIEVKDILSILGSNIQFLGSTGSGSIAKLINQYLVSIHTLAISEAFVTGAAFGINASQLLEVLKTSYGDSKILRRHLEGHILKRQFEPGGALQYLHKDIKLANQLQVEAGQENFLGQFVEKRFEKAMVTGLSQLDMSSIILLLEKETGVTVHHKNNKEG